MRARALCKVMSSFSRPYTKAGKEFLSNPLLSGRNTAPSLPAASSLSNDPLENASKRIASARQFAKTGLAHAVHGHKRRALFADDGGSRLQRHSPQPQQAQGARPQGTLDARGRMAKSVTRASANPGLG
jgi:hypothetical protein